MGGVGQTLAWVARVKINLHGSKNWRMLKSKGGTKKKSYLFKTNDRYIRATCKICSKLTIKIRTSEWRNQRRSGVFTVNFEQISLRANFWCFYC